MMGRFGKIMAAIAALGALSACTTNPATGQSQFILVDEASLAQSAAASWQQLKRAEAISTDRALNRRAQTISTNIINAAGLQNQEWEVVVFDSDGKNAFVLPGGRIGVYRGMMEFVDNDDQLAAVLGHEVGHVVGRHAAERYSQQIGASLGAQVLGGVVAGDSGNASQWAQVFGVGAQLGVLLPYSRAHENQADLIGVDYMVRAGYDPNQAVILWRKMAAEAGSRPPTFMSTHPDPNERADAIRAYIAERGYNG